jgi:signal transduction histidine kinase
MRPVQTITRTAREIGETDLSRRLNLGAQDELGELADTFDGMLERLQAAFERQRQFTADASHELRTPLSILTLESSRMLEKPRTPEEYRIALQTVQAESEWMARLVDEMLTLARLDQAGIGRSSEANDLSEVAVEVLERLQPLAKQRGVRLEAGRLEQARVSASRDHLNRVIANLVENAIKYIGSPGATSDGCVQVETGQETRFGRSGGWVRVSDNGPGIPAEHLRHIFERFYRQDSSRSREQNEDGTGLGLAIVQSIVHSYGGEAEVGSVPGEGSAFTVWLPLEG